MKIIFAILRKIDFLLFPGLLILFSNSCLSQASNSIHKIKKEFEGTWYCKKDKRYIKITFEEGVSYATINEWVGAGNGNTNDNDMDAYRVFIKDNKLIFPADNSEHRTSYCEWSRQAKKLIETCNGRLNFTDQFLKRDKYFRTSIFYKIK